MADTLEGLRAALGDRYLVEREIGAGGMATVYLAQDLRHRRPVAVKVVRPELGGTSGVERFLREIEVASRLQHPHILPVFDSGSFTDSSGLVVPYFVMPYVEGETLRQRLQRGGPLPVGDAVAAAAEVADALAYAHGHGVVHRDIKPENVLITGGHAVVADFGVAKALASGASAVPGQAAPPNLTMAGWVLGTPQYMSPEQATGRDVIDARSDQYSLGCVLYEALTGQAPFEGKTAQAVIAQSMSGPRPRPSRVRAEVPPALEQAVVRAMAVEPAERFLDMAALAAALRASQGEGLSGRVRRRLTLAAVLLAVVAALAGAWLATRAGPRVVAPGAEAIAVLPFNASGAGVEFLREGMVDLLATNLQGVGGIRTVDPRAVLRRWGGRKRAGDGLDQALSVGRDLGAQSVVVGSAVSTGGRVRLAADLYSLKGERIGRAQVDGPADSVLPLVDRLSVALLRDVWRSREPVPSVRIAALTTDSLEALRAFLRGERYYRNLTFDPALAAYSRAVEVDSTFALAHLRRALVYGWTGGYGSKDSRAASAAAQRFASRLTDRDRALLAAYRVFDTGKPAAVDTMRAFLTHYPGDVDGWYLLGEAMFHTRQFAPVPPETVTAAFDSVMRRDSTLEPALLHPIELAVTYRDSAEFFRHFRMMEHTAGVRESDINVGRAAGQLIWGPAPSDSALRGALAQQGHPVMFAAGSFYRSESATSDTISGLFARISALVPATADVRARVLESRAFTLAGLGRVSEVRPLADSLAKLDRNRYAGVLGWPMALGLAPAGFDRGAVDSIVRAMPPGMWPEYAEAIGDLGRGQVAEARRHLAAGLELRDTTPTGPFLRGLLLATRGWAGLVAGDTTGGIRDLRAGLEQAAAPGAGGPTAFLRFQLALALSSRPATRAEGISWLRYAFDTDVLYIPLTYLALGRAYEAAGVRDSAAFAYGRFIHLWDKADPPLVGRVREAREALTRLTAEH